MFGSAEIKVRPVRLAFLVDPNSAKQVREAIKICTSLWGGAFFPIIPLHRRMPATWRDGPFKTPEAQGTILGFIDAFDPDILVQLSKSVPSYINQTGIKVIRPEVIWSRFHKFDSASPAYGIGIFELLQDIYREHFKYKAKYPVRVVFPKLPKQFGLFFSSVFGEVSEKLIEGLRENYFEALEVEHVPVNFGNFTELMDRKVLFPRRITSYQIQLKGVPRFGRGAVGYFMDATKLEDVIDYWNLRATGRDVLPIPKQLLGDPAFLESVKSFLKEHRVPWRHKPEHCDVASIIRSRNSAMTDLEKFAKTINIERHLNDPSNDRFFVLQYWYPRIWDEWARDKDGGVAEIFGNENRTIDLEGNEDEPFRFRSLLPQLTNEQAFTGEVCCINELSFRFYGAKRHLAEVFPKAHGPRFKHAISTLGSFTDWRVGRNGLVKYVKYSSSESRALPASEEIFLAWLADQGWTAELSTPGILAKQIFHQLNGHLYALFNEKLLNLIEYINGGSVNANGTPGAQDIVGQDRHMPLAEVKKRLANKEQGFKDIHDYIVSKGVFRLGLQTKCPRCQRGSWFTLDALDENMKCPKCLNSFAAIGNVNQGTWSYKTAGPFSVPNYADGAFAVLLALNFFNEYRLSSMRTTPILSFTAKGKNKESLEADFALFWSESIYGNQIDGLAFGECKTYGQFAKRDFERMSFLAKTFPGAVLVFSTLRRSLTKSEIVGIKRIAKAGRKYWKSERPINPVLVLTGTELLSRQAPPHCWGEEAQKAHTRLNGLLDVCNATQQKYLSLPSWHQEWHEHLEKRRMRYLERQT